jgi:hypothetical protein
MENKLYSIHIHPLTGQWHLVAHFERVLNFTIKKIKIKIINNRRMNVGPDECLSELASLALP